MLVATTSVPRGAFSEVTSASVLGAGVQRPGGYEGGEPRRVASCWCWGGL